VHHLRVVVRREWRQFSSAVLDALLPAVCPACRAPGEGVCDVCRRALVLRAADGCRRCGEPLGPDGRCHAEHRPLRGISQLLAPFRFVGTGGRLVRRFKLDGDAEAGRLLARAMADRLRAAGLGQRAVLVPVPLHRARRRRRGFDQAAWLARRIARKLGHRDGEGVLARDRATLPQGDPRVLSRTANLRGAFVVRCPERVVGRTVVLVDDVFTTGATARACARLLRQAGARAVVVLVACRS